MNRLLKLVRDSKDMEQFMNKIISFPHWYLSTPELKSMTKMDFRNFYTENKGR